MLEEFKSSFAVCQILYLGISEVLASLLLDGTWELDNSNKVDAVLVIEVEVNGSNTIDLGRDLLLATEILLDPNWNAFRFFVKNDRFVFEELDQRTDLGGVMEGDDILLLPILWSTGE